MTNIFQFKDARDWFFRARFGMFVHWGIYAIPGWHEQHQFRLGIPRCGYVKLAKEFNPVNFNPDAWLDLMQEARMKYICFTAKHIDGFCMWDTKATKYNIMNTPYGKDVLRMLAEACHRRNVPLCIYYAIADMNHPNYPTAGRSFELPAPEAGDEPDEEKYVDFVRAQIRELCTNYDVIHGFWWDAMMFGRKDTTVNALIRKLQPGAVINGRGFDDGDFGTPERNYDATAYNAEPVSRPTEACESIGSQSWGFRKDEDYFTPLYLMRRMDLMFSKGANFLLNIGPDADGVIPSEQACILQAIGPWYNRVSEAWKDAGLSCDLTANRDVILTSRGNVVYVHLTKEPETTSVILKPINILPTRATLLNTGEPVRCDLNRLPDLYLEKINTALRLYDLPVERLANELPVIKLEFDRPVEDWQVAAVIGKETQQL